MSEEVVPTEAPAEAPAAAPEAVAQADPKPEATKPAKVPRGPRPAPDLPASGDATKAKSSAESARSERTANGVRVRTF